MSAMTAPFPSIAWFEELVARATADQVALERLGTADFRLGRRSSSPTATAASSASSSTGTTSRQPDRSTRRHSPLTRCSPAPWKRGAR